MSERLTPETLETIRREAAPRSVSVRLLVDELDAVTRERDELREQLKRATSGGEGRVWHQTASNE